VVLCFRDFTLPTTISIAGSRSVRSGLILILILILIDWYSSEREESWWLFFFLLFLFCSIFFYLRFPLLSLIIPFFTFLLLLRLFFCYDRTPRLIWLCVCSVSGWSACATCALCGVRLRFITSISCLMIPSFSLLYLLWTVIWSGRN
jgi:uncharacterized membrane protein